MSFMLMLSQYTLKQDISVINLLRQHHQSDKVIKTLWQPLCLATMNT
ncbi:MAG: desaturase, partial [Gammaproteobacteria bacterium]